MKNVFFVVLMILAAASWVSATPTTIYYQGFEAGEVNPGGVGTITPVNTTPYPAGEVSIIQGSYGWQLQSAAGPSGIYSTSIVQGYPYAGSNSLRVKSSRLKTDIPWTLFTGQLYKLTFKYMINSTVQDDQAVTVWGTFRLASPPPAPLNVFNETLISSSNLVNDQWYTYTQIWDSTGATIAPTSMRILFQCGASPEDNVGAYIDDLRITYEPYPAPIAGISVKRQSSRHIGVDFDAVHTIDGSGLNQTTHEHSNNPAGTMWLSVSVADVNTQYVVYDLGSWYDLDSVQYWNYNGAGYFDSGIKNMNFLTAKDDLTYVQNGPMRTWSSAAGLETGNFSFFEMVPATQVRFVKLAVVSNWGSPDRVGLSEIRFFGTRSATPPPYVQFAGRTNNNYGNSNNWAEYKSSYVDANTYAVPTGTQVVEIVTTGANSPVVSSIVPDVNTVFVGEWFGNVAGPAAGTLTIAAGGDMVVTEQLNVGRWASQKSHVQINGGYLYAKYLELNWAGNGSDVAIDGGVLEIGSWFTGGNIDIKHSGLFVIAGDVTASIPAWIAGGNLSAYNGTGSLLYDYNETIPGKTTIRANSDVAWGLTFTSPPPTDGLKLAWGKADNAVTHNVYLGYSYDNVLNATTASPECVATGLTVTNFTTRNFNFYPPAVTLYWRIDEVDGSGVAHASPVQTNQISWTWMDDFEHYGAGKDTFTNWWTGTGGATVALASNMYGSGDLEFNYNNASGDSQATLDFTSVNVWGRTQNLKMGNQSSMDISFKIWDYVNDHAVSVYPIIGECSLSWEGAGWIFDSNQWIQKMDAGAGNNPCEYKELITTWIPAGNGNTGTLRSPNFTITGDAIRFWFNGAIANNDPNLYVELVRVSDNAQLKKAMPINDATFKEYVWDVRAYKGTPVFFRAVDNSTTGCIGLAKVEEVTVAFPKLYIKFEDNASHTAKINLDPNFVYPYPGGTKANWLQGNADSAKWWLVSYTSITAANPSIDLTNIKKFTIGYGDGTASGATGKFYFDELTLHIARCEGLGDMLSDINLDCLVDFSDLSIMAAQWLDADGTADIVAPTTSSVNLADFAFLASDWLENDMWPTPWVGPTKP